MKKFDSIELENIRVKYAASVSLKDSESQIQWSRFNVLLLINTVFLGFYGPLRQLRQSVMESLRFN